MVSRAQWRPAAQRQAEQGAAFAGGQFVQPRGQRAEAAFVIGGRVAGDAADRQFEGAYHEFLLSPRDDGAADSGEQGSERRFSRYLSAPASYRLNPAVVGQCAAARRGGQRISGNFDMPLRR